MGGICVAHVDEHIDSLQYIGIFLQIGKTDKLHVKGRAGKGFYHAGIRIILLEINSVMHHMASPRAHLSPAVQHGNLFHTVGYAAFDVIIKLTELIADRFHIVQKFREIQRQL